MAWCAIPRTIEYRDGEIERLKSIIKQLQRMQFGRRSEHIDADQLVPGLEDIDSDVARIKEGQSTIVAETESRPRGAGAYELRGHAGQA